MKGMAPQPPSIKPKPIIKGSSESRQAMVLLFDELVRNELVLEEGSAEEKFLQFTVNQDFCRKRWEAAEVECQRLQIELQNTEQVVKKLEFNLNQAREILAGETSLRKKAENERDLVSERWEQVKELISSDQGLTMNDATRQRIERLEASMSFNRRGTVGGGAVFSPGQQGLNPICEIDSTGSILDASDLSFDNTQGTMGGDESRLKAGRMYKRKSSGGVSQMNKRERRSGPNLNRKSLEALAARRSAGGGGAIGLSNALRGNICQETGGGAIGLSNALRNNNYQERNIDDYIPTAPPVERDEDVEWHNRRNVLTPQASTATVIARSPTRHPSTVTLTPSQTSTTTLTPLSTPAYTPGKPVRRTFSNSGGINRKHQFVQKNNFKTEICLPCQKRIKFGKVCFKCKECRATSHPECRDNVPLPCVPVGSAQKTPAKSGKLVLADYTPLTSPMIPALIIHCVNEIEARGMEEVGLYRVPGSEREVKDLKEKFLAGRGCPKLGQFDVHTLTGVVKDFLRSLKEPLVPHSMWYMFTDAASNPDMTNGESDLYQAISELPKPNRDTMAYMMLHLQKIAECEDIKMPVTNIAKILGPTIIGYSTADPHPEDIMKEVAAQSTTMEKLILIDSSYWRTFIADPEGENLYVDNQIFSPGTPEFFPNPMREAMSDVQRRKIAPKGLSPTKIFASPVLL